MSPSSFHVGSPKHETPTATAPGSQGSGGGIALSLVSSPSPIKPIPLSGGIALSGASSASPIKPIGASAISTAATTTTTTATRVKAGSSDVGSVYCDEGTAKSASVSTDKDTPDSDNTDPGSSISNSISNSISKGNINPKDNKASPIVDNSTYLDDEDDIKYGNRYDSDSAEKAKAKVNGSRPPEGMETTSSAPANNNENSNLLLPIRSVSPSFGEKTDVGASGGTVATNNNNTTAAFAGT